jgi:Peptidase family M23
MRCSRFLRLPAVVTTISAAGATVAVLAAPVAHACEGAWVKPVDGAVVDPFRAPAHTYGPGNRGIDLAAGAGTPVRAAGDGVVAFAGQVGGTRHVVVEHAGGLRTTYAFLESIGVRARERVTRGQVIGASGGTGAGQPPNSMHFGLRLGDRYVDPSVLFGPCDLTEIVHLAPVDQPAREPWDRLHAAGIRTIQVEEGGGGLVGDIAGALGSVASLAGDAAGTAWDTVSDAGGAVVGAATRYGSSLFRELARRARDTLARSPVVGLLSVLGEFATRFSDWWEQRGKCADDSPEADGTGGSTHLLLAVGGINSRGGPERPTFNLDAEALGYHDDEVTYFSYAPDGGRYLPEDTWGDLLRAANQLDAQLRQSQRDHPGREVDLIAHSQGGVVVDVFLQTVYKPGDPGLPPIGNVVTLSSPHEGAPLATSAQNWREHPIGKAVVDAADEHLPVPPADAPSVTQIDEDSPFLRQLWRHRLPDHIDFTTIGATDDVVVPATQIGVPGATEVVVDVGGGPLDDHSNIPDDPKALRAVRAALEGRPPPCTGVGDGLRGAVMPVLISRAERGLGALPGFP